MKNPFQSTAFKVPTAHGSHTVRDLSTYPTVPANWPSRALRRHPERIRAVLPPPVPYLVACLVARLTTTSVITVDSAGVARL